MSSGLFTAFRTEYMVAVLLASSAGAATLTVEVSGKLAPAGPVKVALWNQEATFLKGKPLKLLSAEHKGGTARVVFTEVPPGIYAVSAFHDKNNNGRLDTGFMGKPSEPYGFSNDARGTFGPAKFRDAKFTLDASGANLAIHLK